MIRVLLYIIKKYRYRYSVRACTEQQRCFFKPEIEKRKKRETAMNPRSPVKLKYYLTTRGEGT